MERNKVVLVDHQDQSIGEMDKMKAHREGHLHRAFSVFIFNDANKILIHQRAEEKYHGSGLWTNACCSHPQLGEDVKTSAIERLNFEMGLNCDIHKVFSFIYNTSVENGLIEHELDHVFFGYTDQQPQPNPLEVQAYKWVKIDTLLQDMDTNPNCYTQWFKMALPQLLQVMKTDNLAR